MSPAREANRRLVEQMIARGALWSRPLIDAFLATPRHHFLDHFFHFEREEGAYRERRAAPPTAGDLRLIYADRAVTTHLSPAAAGSVGVPVSSSSQPSLMAQMLEDLLLAPGQRVLEVGAGTGYNAALLAYVAGAVVSLDVDQEILAEAAGHLQRYSQRHVQLVHGDGRAGWPEGGPYDRIQVTAASPDIEPAWVQQLANDGLVQAPLELAPGLAFTVQGGAQTGRFEGRLVRPAYFMPLRAEGGEGRAAPDELAGLLAESSRLLSVPAPWADWEDRKLGAQGANLPASLAFLGWLQGCTVCYQDLVGDRTAHGVADLVRGHACWLGGREWRVTGQAGEELGKRLWRTFLEAGGPRPTEFRLRAWPHATAPAPIPDPSARLAFVREGPLTVQLWELPEPRERPGWV